MDIAIVAASADGISHLWVVRGDTGIGTSTRTLFVFHFYSSNQRGNYSNQLNFQYYNTNKNFVACFPTAICF